MIGVVFQKKKKKDRLLYLATFLLEENGVDLTLFQKEQKDTAPPI